VCRCYPHAVYIEFQISEADYLAAVHLFSRTRRGGWLRIYVLPPIFLIFALPLVPLCFISWRMAFVIFPLVVALAQPAANIFLNRRRLAKLYRDNIAIQSRNFITIDDTGDHSRDVAIDRFTPWEKFSGYTEGKKTFLRHLPETKQFYITPKRELTDAQVAELRALLKAHLPERPAQPTRRTFAGFTAASAVAMTILCFVVPPYFWYRQAGRVGRESATLAIPRPPSDNSLAQLDGSSMQAYGCSLTVPWKALNLPPATNRTDDADGDPPIDYMKFSLSDRFVLHFHNPQFQADNRGLLAPGPHMISSGLRRDLGPTLSSQYGFQRATLYAQPGQANLFATANYNRRLFALLQARSELVWNFKGSRPVYDISAGENRGFQFGDPAKKPFRIDLDLYTPEDRRITLQIFAHSAAPAALTQSQINAMVASLHCSGETPSNAPFERSRLTPISVPR
jgi:hypothetical protein